MDFAFPSFLETSSVPSPVKLVSSTRIIISEHSYYHTILSCIWGLQREIQIRLAYRILIPVLNLHRPMLHIIRVELERIL